MAVVYKIHFTGSSKFYIGSALVFSRRVANHKHKLLRGTHENPILQSMFNKYRDYYYEILEECSKETVLSREQECIDILQPELNINKIAGRPPVRCGNDHWLRSDKGVEYRKELSKRVARDLNPAKRPEVRQKISDAKKGRKFPNLSKAKKGKPGTMKNKKHSDSALFKMRQPRRRTACPVCSILIGLNNIKRHIETHNK